MPSKRTGPPETIISTSSPRAWTGAGSRRSLRSLARRACVRAAERRCAWRSGRRRIARGPALKLRCRRSLQREVGPVGSVVLGKVFQNQRALILLELGHALLVYHPVDELVPALAG